MFGKQIYIIITPRRDICHYCDENPTTAERLDWYEINSKYSKPYQQHVIYMIYIKTAKIIFKNQVPVIAAHFHVAKLYRRSLVTLRKAQLRRLRKQLFTEEYHKLKLAIILLKKQRDYFSEDETKIVTFLFNYSPQLKLAYQLSLKLTLLFNSDLTKQQAKKNWCFG